jgi:hypothetical protein
MGDVIPIDGPLRLKLKDRGRVCRAIVKGEEFKAGNMAGSHVDPCTVRIDGKWADYQVTSYSTILGLHVPTQRYRVWDDDYQHDVVMTCDDHWVLFNTRGLSSTTERHAEILRGALVIAKTVQK